MSTRRARGRRRAEVPPSQGPRVPSRAVLAVGLAPVVVFAAALAHGPAQQQVPAADVAPETVPLTSVSLACPQSASGSGKLVLGHALQSRTTPEGEPAAGEVTARETGTDQTVPVELRLGGRLETRTPAGVTVVRGTGGLAPGLYGARISSAAEPSAGECVSPVGERWFAAIGAGGDHTSGLELVNPDTGPAVADVTLWSTDGELEEVESRGLTIPGERSTTLEIEDLAPHRSDLTMRVSVARGRVAAMVDDSYRFESAPPTSDWVPATGGPATTLVVPALPRRAGERTLVLANPGDSEARVTLQVAGADSTFSPTGIPEVRVPAGRVVVTDLTASLRDAVRNEDAALVVESNTPVVGSVRSVVAGDLVHSPAVTGGTGVTAAVVPPGGRRVVALTSTGASGRVEIEFVGSGKPARTTSLRTGTTRSVPVPGGTTAVLVRSGRAYVGAVRRVGDEGAALSPLRTLVFDRLLPSVVPVRDSAQSPR